jgi:hypothetical protein
MERARSEQPSHEPEPPAPAGPRAPAPASVAGVLALQRSAGNAATTALLQRAPGSDETFKSKTVGTSGGLTGLTLDVTFTVSGTPADGLQVIQTFMGTRRDDKVRVGTYTWIYKGRRWDAFVDGGKNSPFVTMTGEDPAHPTRPYYLTQDEVDNQVTWDTDHGTVRIFDAPGAVALHDAAYFETAIVAINYRKTGRDKVLRVFKWGWTEKGGKPTIKKGTEIAGVDSGVKVRSSPSPEWRNIVKHDYPKYKYD